MCSCKVRYAARYIGMVLAGASLVVSYALAVIYIPWFVIVALVAGLAYCLIGCGIEYVDRKCRAEAEKES